MDSVVTTLNSVGQGFCDYAARVSVQSALLILVIFLMNLLLRKRIRAVLRYGFWLLGLSVE